MLKTLVLINTELILVPTEKEKKPPDIKSISEKCKHTENHYIRIILRTKPTLKEFTHKNQTTERSATDGTMHL
jgi:hypothetical protein